MCACVSWFWLAEPEKNHEQLGDESILIFSCSFCPTNR